MAEANFRVIITGEIAAEFNYSDVVKTAAKLFRCTPAQAQKLLGNQPTTLKRAMDKQTAMRYCQQLLRAGIICRIESDAQKAIHSASARININNAIAQDTATQAVSLAGGLAAEKPILQAHDSHKSTREALKSMANHGNLSLQNSQLSLEPIANDSAVAQEKTPPMPSRQLSPASGGPALSLEATNDASLTPSQGQNSTFEPTATHEIICPKCKNVQRIASECSHCGIVFSKFVGDKKNEIEAAETNNEDVEASAREWEELSWFVGENYESYRHKFVAIANNDDKFVPQWHWPAFLVPYAWFIHRKLYAYYAIYLAYYIVMIILGVAPFVSALIGNTICAVSANFIYYRHAKRKIELCDDDVDARRIDIIEAGETNSIFLTLGATLGLIILTWILIFNFMVKPVVNAMLNSLQQDQAFIEQGSKDEKTTRAAMVMLKNVVVGTMVAKKIAGEEFDIPNNLDDLQDALKMEPAAADLHFKDGWGKSIHYYGDNQRIRIESAGADSKWNSEDDIVLESKVPQLK